MIGTQPSFDGSLHRFEMDNAQWSAALHAISDARAVDWYLVTFVNEDMVNAPIVEARIWGW